VLSCLNSAYYVTSRVLFALAAKGDAPAALVKLNSRGVPVRSVLMGSAAGLAGIAAATASPTVVFAFLINASGSLIVYIYLLIAIAQIRLRFARSPAQQAALPVQMWFFPATSFFAVAGLSVVLLAMAVTPALATQFYAGALSLAVILLATWVHSRRRASRTNA